MIYYGCNLKRVFSGLTGPDANTFLNRYNKNLAIADLARICRLTNCGHNLCQLPVGNDHFYFNLRKKINHILSTAVNFRVPLLSPETPHLGYRHSFDSQARQPFFHILEPEWLDNRFDFFHSCSPPLKSKPIFEKVYRAKITKMYLMSRYIPARSDCACRSRTPSL